MKRETRRTDKATPGDVNAILPEYDFRRAEPNKYSALYAAGSSVVVLDSDTESGRHVEPVKRD
jgi:hypothetical protein